jgi:hypothetical protein
MNSNEDFDFNVTKKELNCYLDFNCINCLKYNLILYLL